MVPSSTVACILSSCQWLSRCNARLVFSSHPVRQRQFASTSGDDEDREEGTAASTSAPAAPAENEGASGRSPTKQPVKEGFRRSLSDVLGQDLALSLVKAKQELGPTDEELDALFGVTSEGKTEADKQEKMNFPDEPERAEEAKQPDAAHALHEKYGYAVLGGVVPTDLAASTSDQSRTSFVFKEQPRLHPKRTFVPGQSYEPSDLNAYALKAPKFGSRKFLQQTMPSAAEVRLLADYKNVAFLSQFLNPAGRLLPRKKTKLPVHDHILVVSQIKIARTMGLMAHETRLEKEHLGRVREAERRVYQEQGIIL